MGEGSKKDSEEHVEQGEGEAGEGEADEKKRKRIWACQRKKNKGSERKWVKAGIILWEGGLLDPRQEAIGIHEMPGR